MKKTVGVISIIIGAFFLFTVFSWEEADTVMAQTLKWSVSGFGIAFILGGLYAIASSLQDNKRKKEAYQIQMAINGLIAEDKTAITKNRSSQSMQNHMPEEPIFRNAEDPVSYDEEKSGVDFEPWKM